MNKFSLKSFLVENGFLEEVSTVWRNDFITGAKNMPKTTDAVLDYISNIYFTAFDGEDNIKAINKNMVRWLVEQIIVLGGPENVDTNSRNKLLRVMQWFRISGEGNLPKMTLDAAFEYAQGKFLEREKKEQNKAHIEPDEIDIEKNKIVKRVHVVPDGSGRRWVLVDQPQAGNFFDSRCKGGRPWSVGCQSNLNDFGMDSSYRGLKRTTLTLIGPENEGKGHVTTIMSLSINSNGVMDQGKQVGNQGIGSPLYGYNDLMEVFIDLLGSKVGKEYIKNTTDNHYISTLVEKNKYELLNKLDASRPDIIENNKVYFTSDPKASEWYKNRSLDALDAFKKYGPSRFLENIFNYAKSKTYNEAVQLLIPKLPEVIKNNPEVIIGKLSFILDIIPAEVFVSMFDSLLLNEFILHNSNMFESFLKKLSNVNNKDSKLYKELFKKIITDNFEIISRANGKGLDGVKKFMTYLEMPKSDKHTFVKKTPDGKIIAHRKEIKREGGIETSKDVEFELPENLALTTQKERRDLLKRNELYIKSLIDGDAERKEINFLRMLFTESNPQDVKRTLSAEKEKFIQYYNNPKHLTKYNMVRGVPLPGIFEFYKVFNRGQTYGTVETREKPYLKFDLEDLRDSNIARQVVGFFTKLYMVDKNVQIIGPEGQYEILDDYLNMLDIAGESHDKIIEILNKYKPSELSFYKGKVDKIPPVVYTKYYSILSYHTSNAHALADIKANMDDIVQFTSLSDYEKLLNKYGIMVYDVDVADFVEYIGPKTSGLKKSDPKIDADRGRKYNVGEIIDNDRKDKIRIYDNSKSLSDFIPTKWFKVDKKPLSESIVRSLIRKKLQEAENAKGKIKSEKETLKELQNLLGKQTVWLTKKNAYGDRRKYAFGFDIKEVAKKYGAIDKAPPGYSNQYDVDISELLENELKQNGFNVINIHVGSWVHGWIHCVVTKNI